jgi:hypothetical protein
MSNRSEVAQKELDSLNSLQTFLGTSRSDDEKLYIPFLELDLLKFARTTRYDQKMVLTLKDDMYVFDIPDTSHFLMWTDLVQILPEVKLQPKYLETHRISWKPKTGLVLIESAQLYERKNERAIGEKLTSETLDLWLEYLAKKCLDEEYEVILADLEGETRWATRLPQKTLIVPQPFFYSLDSLRALKMCILNGGLDHRYTFRRRVEQLLRMQELKDGKWVSCKTDAELCEFSDITADAVLKHSPELHGAFSRISDKELQQWKEFEGKRPYLEHCQEFVQLELSGKAEESGSFKEKIESLGCIRGIYWMIRCREDFFSYDNQGTDPVESITLKYGDETVFSAMPSFHHSRRLPRRNKLRTPQLVGYHYQPFCFEGLLTDGADTQVSLGKLNATLIINYRLPKNVVGKPVIILDVHRVARYREGRLDIVTSEDPEPQGK